MSDTVFRTKIEPATTPLPEGHEPSQGEIVDVEVPYMDYETSQGHPYTVDYFKLGDTWEDPEGGFYKEISTLEDFVSRKIKTGEIANKQGDVKTLLKQLEKVTNVDKESRPLVKIETLAAYVEFLMKTDTLKSNLKRYANT